MNSSQISSKEVVAKSIVVITLMIITFIICMRSPLDIFTKNGKTSTDSSVFKYIAWTMTKGDVPYRDTFDHKGPLLYFINYIGVLIARHRGVWIIEVIFMFFSVSFLYLLSRKFIDRGYSILVTLMTFAPIYEYFEGGNLTEEYALLFQIIALNIFFDFFENPSKRFVMRNSRYFNLSVCICGICFICVFFLRANMISIWITFCVMVFIYCINQKMIKELWKFVFSFIIGILVIAIPIIIYFYINHALGDFFEDYILFNMMYSSNESRANFGNRVVSFVTFFNTVPTIMAFVIILVKIINKVKIKKDYYFDFGYLIYMILTLLLICMSGRTYGHYGMTLLPMLVYPYSSMFKYLEIEDWKQKKVGVIVSCYLLITLIIPNWTNMVGDTLKDISKRHNIGFSSAIVDYIVSNTTEEDVISVFGNYDIIYLFSNRKSASKYSYQNPIGTVINSKYLEEYFVDLYNKLPKVIVWQLNTSSFPEAKKRMITFLEENEYSLVIDGDIKVYSIVEKFLK